LVYQTQRLNLETTGELVSDEQKMRVFLKGLIDPKLEAAKAQVMVNNRLRVVQQQYTNEDRSVRQRTDTEKFEETNSTGNNRSVLVGTVARVAGIGPVMSRRYPNGQQPADGGPVT
jgi:hypothetical protein